MPSPIDMNKPSSKAGKPHKPPSSDTDFSMPHDEILDNFDLDPNKDDDKTYDSCGNHEDGTCKTDSDCCGNECCSEFGFCGKGVDYCGDTEINMDDSFEYNKAKQKSDRKKKRQEHIRRMYDNDAMADNFGRRILRPNEDARRGSGKPMKTRLRRRSV